VQACKRASPAAGLVAREAHLVLSLTKLLLDILLGPGSKRREGGTRGTVSACLLCAAQQQNMGSQSSYVPKALSECRYLAEVVHGDVCVRNNSRGFQVVVSCLVSVKVVVAARSLHVPLTVEPSALRLPLVP
jgi:hypothetical protein